LPATSPATSSPSTCSSLPVRPGCHPKCCPRSRGGAGGAPCVHLLRHGDARRRRRIRHAFGLKGARSRVCPSGSHASCGSGGHPPRTRSSLGPTRRYPPAGPARSASSKRAHGRAGTMAGDRAGGRRPRRRSSRRSPPRAVLRAGLRGR
jgi:hypothetical protein